MHLFATVLCLLVISQVDLTTARKSHKNNPIKYEPNWASLDSRPTPTWFHDAKVGIFIHTGIWSVSGAGFPDPILLWQYLLNNQTDATDYMHKFYPPGFSYPEFAPMFKMEFFDPNEWVEILKAAGAKYVVTVAKHFDGYALWPSDRSFNWNSVTIGPKRDLLGDLINAIRKNSDIKVGAFYSDLEFSNELYSQDKKKNFTTRDYVNSHVTPMLKDLISTYKPDILWNDGEWEAEASYWGSEDFLAWLFNESPVADTIVVDDRWGNVNGSSTLCTHGGYWTCGDRFNPRVKLDHKWENVMTLDLNAWGYRLNYDYTQIMSMEVLLEELVTTVSCGGNILVNVGVNSQGKFPVIFEERLRQMGDWLAVNSDAIYGTIPWNVQNDTLNANQVWYTSTFTTLSQETTALQLFAISLKWPTFLESYDHATEMISLNTEVLCSKINSVSILGFQNSTQSSHKSSEDNERILNFSCDSGDLYVVKVSVGEKSISILESASKWAWSFRIVTIF